MMLLILTSVLLFGTVSSQTGNEVINDDDTLRYVCPKQFFRAGNHCYYLSHGKSDWETAHKKCREIKRGSNMAILENKYENRFLRRYLNHKKPDLNDRWIGGTYNWRRNKWVWGKTGEDFTYNPFSREWRKREKGSMYMCAVLDPTEKYSWTKRSCKLKKHFICEYPIRIKGRRRNIPKDPNRFKNSKYLISN